MIETLVALLLIVTIGYCMLLNTRLKRLKADEHSLRAVIRELITATEIAERAIGGLKLTVRDVNEHLGGQIAAASEMSEYLQRQLAEGDQVVRRLSKIAIAARPAGAASDPEASKDSGARDTGARDTGVKALAAAAQAFSDRKRSGGLAA
jgi:hypothetical protein